MNVVFLSPHFPPNMYLYCTRLRDAGATVLGVADAPWEDLRPELRSALTEYFRVDDLSSTDGLVRALGYLTWRHGRIDRIDSLNEHWLEAEAGLRDAFDVPGLRTADMVPAKRKAAMKAVYQSAGIPVARGRIVRTNADAQAFVDEVGYPLIAKPDVGVGAARTLRIDDADQLADWLGEPRPVDYLLEEWLEGELLSYDGLVDRAGRIVFSSSLVYGIPVLEAVQGQDMFFWIDRQIAPDLAELGERTVRAFGVRERPFHFEFFRLPDGSLAGVEVNMRQPGGITVDMWNWANDIDFYRAWADVVVTGTAEVETTRPWYCFWAGRKLDRRYRLSDDEVRERYADLLIHVEHVRDVFAPAMGNVGYVMRHVDLAVLRQAGAAILEPADVPAAVGSSR
jgi:hypothetical protein